MSRIVLLFSLLCSIALNVYLFMQVNVDTFENIFQKNIGITSQQGAAPKAKDKDNTTDNTTNIQHLVNKIKNAIKTKDYFNASYLINTLANDHQSELASVRLFWLRATQALIQQKLFTHAENSIDAYLSFEGDDGDFLYQQVDLYWQQRLPLVAIKHAYEVQYHLYNEVEIRDSINFSRELVQQQAEELINNTHWLELRDLVEEVQVFDPESHHFQWLFVRAQFHLGEFEFARSAIEPLLALPNYKIKAQALLADIETALRSPQSIELSRQGEHFIVEALINDTFNVSLMLDTGASISLLSQLAFEALNEQLDVVYIEDLSLNTAGGVVTASIYQIAEFSIQDYVVNDFIFAVSPSYLNEGSEGSDGLLGMNFLKSFDFHIDQKNSRLILKNK